MKNILIVEDSPEVQLLVRGALGARDNLYFANSFTDAISLINRVNFDLALIDVGLPDGDGFQVCSILKANEKTEQTQIIFLTSRSNLADKLVGFSVGADDYILKPFEPLELRARIESRLKRNSSSKNILIKGPLKLDLPCQKVYLLDQDQTRDLHVTPIEFRLLYFFWTHEGHILSRAQLLAGAWGADVSIAERSVDVHIHSLRRKLGPISNSIRSVFAEGYSFSMKSAPDLGPKDHSPEP